MNIIISSKPHLGKTTVTEKLVNKLKENNIPVGGILCKEEDIQDIATGKTCRFLHKDEIPDSQKIGPYHIKNSIINFGEQAIKKAISSGAFAVIDEYGLLEIREQGFHKITENTLSSNKCIILVRKINLEEFLERFNKYKFRVFELTEHNKEKLHEEIFEYIIK